MRLLTEIELAELLRLNGPDPVRTVRKLVRREGAAYTRVGSKVRFTEAQYEKRIELLCRRF